jgi:hypothetical protein
MCSSSSIVSSRADSLAGNDPQRSDAAQVLGRCAIENDDKHLPHEGDWRADCADGLAAIAKGLA